jgi:hypothetical protein
MDLQRAVRAATLRHRRNTWSFSGQFDFAANPALPPKITLTAGAFGEVDYSCCYEDSRICWPFSAEGDSGGGSFTVTLPTRVGDSAPFEPVVSVEPTTWSAVKRLYR